MQQLTNKTHINKDTRNSEIKRKASEWLNHWLTKIGLFLNTSDLSNYK